VRPALLLAVACAAAACSSGPRYARGGSVAPTVSGAQPPAAPSFSDLAAAKAAFARTDGDMTAVLEDAAWIRLEPDASRAAERHADYAAGLTSFEVTLKTDTFVRPTDEVYVLTDSTGANVSSRPTSYVGGDEQGGRKQVASFTLSFRHVLDRSVKWVRLTRQGAGTSTVQWDFP
jgi:hypothetical protein